MGRRSKKKRAKLRAKTKLHSTKPALATPLSGVKGKLSLPTPPPEAKSDQKVKKSPFNISRLFSRLSLLIQKLQLFLFSLTLFLIPTNLAYHFRSESAHVHGILVDYLIPKLYLSDLPILAILALWPLQILLAKLHPSPHQKPPSQAPESKPATSKKKGRFTLSPAKPSFLFPLFLFLTALLTSASNSPNPAASLWYIAKLVQLGLFIAWIRTISPSLSQFAKPITLAALFQSLIAILQWVQKKSLLGYLFFGETTLKTTSHIAKTAITGDLRPLPYGTTSHPNILAGFLAISLIFHLLNQHFHPPQPQSLLKKLFRYSQHAIYYCLLTLALLLTQSVTAIIALLIGLAILIFRRFSPATLLSFIAIAVTAALVASTFVEPESFSRRTQLNAIALDMISNHPILGIGPNNFSASLPQFGHIQGYTRFYQPVHNIYLLWLAETGFLGTGALILLLYSLTRFRPSSVSPFILNTPFIMLLLIGLVDHYPISLQTGQLMLAVSIGLIITSSQTLNST